MRPGEESWTDKKVILLFYYSKGLREEDRGRESETKRQKERQRERERESGRERERYALV